MPDSTHKVHLARVCPKDPTLKQYMIIDNSQEREHCNIIAKYLEMSFKANISLPTSASSRCGMALNFLSAWTRPPKMHCAACRMPLIVIDTYAAILKIGHLSEMLSLAIESSTLIDQDG